LRGVGINAINELKKLVKGQWHRIELGEFNHSFNYLLQVLGQFEYLLAETKRYSVSSKRKNYLQHKLSTLFLSYFNGILGASIEDARINDSKNPFQRFIRTANDFANDLLDERNPFGNKNKMV
jgi:hypothetical protein